MVGLFPGQLGSSGVLLAVITTLSSCVTTLDDVEIQRVPSQALRAATESTLGRLFWPPGEDSQSLFATVDRGGEAFDLRLALATAAESSIDAQSYLWHEDSCGSLLLDRLLQAADRGVRVRLLIDGFKLEGHEELDEALDLHPNLEIRIFNPTVHRAGLWRQVELIENIGRLDHRMHNKLFLVDGVAGVFGGRNIGDEYFGLGEEADLRDFDLLASGPVVQDLATAFDEFWNGEWTVPLNDLVTLSADESDGETHAAARAVLRNIHSGDPRLEARSAHRAEDWLVALGHARTRMVSGQAEVMHDSEHVQQVGATGILARAFEAALSDSPGDALIVTAYLVPDQAFLENVRQHVAAGGRVRILTNSHVTTNQPLVHKYYAKSRRALLETGAELFELRGDAFSHVHHRSAGSVAPKLGLHAKSAVFGEEHVLVGSMNIDPRSMVLNTELGVLVASRELADEVRACLAREFAPRNAWHVTIAPDGGLQWASQGVVLREEPAPSDGEGLRAWFLSLLPLRGEV